MTEILYIKRGDALLVPPPKMIARPEKRNRRLYCARHRDHGHDTNSCRHLKSLVEDLIQHGRWTEFVGPRSVPALPNPAVVLLPPPPVRALKERRERVEHRPLPPRSPPRGFMGQIDLCRDGPQEKMKEYPAPGVRTVRWKSPPHKLLGKAGPKQDLGLSDDEYVTLRQLECMTVTFWHEHMRREVLPIVIKTEEEGAAKGKQVRRGDENLG